MKISNLEIKAYVYRPSRPDRNKFMLLGGPFETLAETWAFIRESGINHYYLLFTEHEKPPAVIEFNSAEKPQDVK